MKYKSVFDIIGPVMVGPSSSHTAGAVRIGFLARKLFGKAPKEVKITLYGSFAKTYRGHATDVALCAGLLNFSESDKRIPNARKLAKQLGINIKFIESKVEHPTHPNVARLELFHDSDKLTLVGISIGGGNIQVESIKGLTQVEIEQRLSIGELEQLNF